MKRPPALRLRIPSGLDAVRIDDRIAGPFEQQLERDVGDFVLRRGDGVTAYQLAVVVDDLASSITDVVRGADLLPSTPRQVLLTRMLGGTEARYWHLPLVVSSEGERLAKRTPAGTIRQLREAGVTAEEIVGELAFGLGLAPSPEPTTPRELAARDPAWPPETWRHSSWRIPARWAERVE